MNVGIWEMWDRGDVISHGIAVVLIVMSIASWAVLLYKVAQLLRMKAQGALVARRFWKAEALEDGAAQLGKPSEGNPYQRLVEAAREARKRHDDASLQEALSPDEWLQRCLGVAFEEQAGRMATGLGVLASVGSTAPFVGLFGTVWGIYHALGSIAASGQAQIENVAGPVVEALIMTAFGLVVAIPAVLAYNVLGRLARQLSDDLDGFAHDLHAYVCAPAAEPRRHEPVESGAR